MRKSKVNALAEGMGEQVCQKEYRSCSRGLTHAHRDCADRPASRDLVVARQRARLVIAERVCLYLDSVSGC